MYKEMQDFLDSEENQSDKVRLNDWSDMSLHQLYEQKNILNNRIKIAANFLHDDVIELLQNGIFRLDVEIEKRHTLTNKNNRTFLT